jgi:hypothetical protein
MRFLLHKNLEFGFLHGEEASMRRMASESTPQEAGCGASASQVLSGLESRTDGKPMRLTIKNLDLRISRSENIPLRMKSFYNTTAIDYVNVSPHLCHAY